MKIDLPPYLGRSRYATIDRHPAPIQRWRWRVHVAAIYPRRPDILVAEGYTLTLLGARRQIRLWTV